MVRVQNLTQTFGDFTAVDNLSFENAAGEIVTFPALNGAGKTTAIKRLTTLLKPQAAKSKLTG